MPAPQRILLIRLSAIGDVVMASPLVDVLRRAWPQAHIAWLIQPEPADIITAHRGLDEVIVWPRAQWTALARAGRWWRLARAFASFAAMLRDQHFDLVIDAQGLLKSAIWAWATRAPRRVGLNSREGSGALMTQVLRARADPRISAPYRQLAQGLGLDPGAFPLRVVLEDADRQFAQRWIERNDAADGYAVLCPFTTRPQKHWREARWAELAQRLEQELGLRAVLLGGPGDVAAAARIAPAGDRLLNLAGQTGLRQCAALIEAATLSIGVDTGLTHMAIAFDVPGIALFGSTCPYRDAGRAHTVIVYKDLHCAPCRRRPTCDGAYTCLSSITVEEVMVHARRLVRIR